MKTIQLWPQGVMLRYDFAAVYGEDGQPIRGLTDDDKRAIEIEERAGRLLEQEVYCLDSCLVDDLLQLSGHEAVSNDLTKEFAWDNVSNLTPDPSDWDVDECREWLHDNGHDRDIVDLDTTETEDEDAWREAVRDNAEPAEIYEWWRVSKWLATKLDAVGECVLTNSYGQWWGRCTTGQAVIMDGVLQKVAASL